MKTIHKFIILAIFGCLLMYSFSGCSNSTSSSSTSTDQQTISASDYKIKFLGDVWSSVVFHHKEHAERFDDCYECHYCAGVQGETLWNCRSCHSPGNTEGLCEDDGTHGCIMAQCNYCHEDLARNPGLDCADCHTDGALANTGHFVDSPVQGLDYQTATISGITDEAGTFYFRDGETITFFIEDLLLGTASAKTEMTPLDLVEGATDVTNPAVTNICRLLMSLDVDGNPDNGITISDDVKDELAGRSINFNQSTVDFGNDPDVLALLDSLNQLGVFTDGGVRTLCSPTEAQDHITATLISLDTPPTATFSGGLQVSGSNTCIQCHTEAANINGLYNEDGSLNGKPKYSHEIENFWIHWNTVDTGEWQLSDDTVSATYMYHYDVTNPGGGGDSPPLGAWGSGCTRDGKNSTATLSAVGGINGNTWVGAELTSSYEYYDEEGDLEGVSLYRWYRCDDTSGTNDVRISGATDATYTLVDDDVGKYIRFEVIPAAASGNTPGEAVQSGAVGPVTENPAPSATNVAIDGDVEVNATLTGTYDYEDEMNDPEDGSTYQWYRDDVEIPDATSLTYTVAAEDEGKYLKFEVTPGAAAGDSPGTTVISDAVGPVGPDPLNEVPTAGSVVISGEGGCICVNSVLTGEYVYSDTENNPEASTYKWYISDSENGAYNQIGGEIFDTYTPINTDQGKWIKFEVTPGATKGNTPGLAVGSAPVQIIADPNNAAPTISNVYIEAPVHINSLATGRYTYDDAENDPDASTYKWYLCDDASGTNDVEIANATSDTYMHTNPLDEGKYLKFEVTLLAQLGNNPSPSLIVKSAPVIIQPDTGNAVPEIVGDPSITGADGCICVNSMLTGNYTYSDAENDPEASTYKWYISDSENGAYSEIANATSDTYTPVHPEDELKWIKFEVTPRATRGNTPGTAKQSAAVEIQIDPENSAPTAFVYSGIRVRGVTYDAGAFYIDSAYEAHVNGIYQIAATRKYYDCSPKDCVDPPPNLLSEDINGIANGRVAYKHENYDYYLAWNDGCSLRWRIADSTNRPGDAGAVSVAKNLGEDSYTPPLGYWGNFGDPEHYCGRGATLSLYGGGNEGDPDFDAYPGISGDPIVGTTLTGAYKYEDADGDIEGQSTFRWLRSATVNGAYQAISNATGTTYTLTAADEGMFIKFEVTPIAATGSLQGDPVTSSYAGIGPVIDRPDCYNVSNAGKTSCNGTYYFRGYVDNVPYPDGTPYWQKGDGQGNYEEIYMYNREITNCSPGNCSTYPYRYYYSDSRDTFFPPEEGWQCEYLSNGGVDGPCPVNDSVTVNVCTP